MSVGNLLKSRIETNIASFQTLSGVSALMSGTVFAAVIPVVFSPLLTRVFTPADYGVIGLYLSISSIIGVFACSHYSHAIMLAPTLEDARQTLWLAISISAIVSLLVFLLTASLFTLGVSMFSVLSYWVWFLPLSVFFNGVTTSLSVWANRVKNYNSIAANRIAQALITVLVQLLIGLYVASAAGLVVGVVLGQAIGALLIFRRFYVKSDAKIGAPVVSNFIDIAVRYRNLLYFNTPSELINGLINQAPYLLLQQFSGTAAVGNYGLSQRLLGLPQVLISNSITEIFKQKVNAYNQAGSNLKKIFLKTFKTLSLMAVVPFLVLVIWGPDIVTFVFGAQWHQAGEFTRFLAVMFFFRFIIGPLTYVYFVVGKFKEDLYLHILLLAVTLLSFYCGFYFFDSSAMMILLYAVGYSLVYLIYFFRSLQFVNK